jgi:diguanylate cyclase (GGDEF)-like protein
MRGTGRFPQLLAIEESIHRIRKRAVGRWGGEEFIAILPDADGDQTVSMAERCRMLVRSSSVSVADTTVTLTLSVGATVLQPSDTEDSWFHRVDRALYQSKQNGRDRVTLSVP